MGVVLAPIGLAALWVAAFSVREHSIPEPPVAFIGALRGVLRNRRFQIFLLGLAVLWFGLSMISLSLAFMITVLMGMPRAAVGRVLAVTVGLTIVSLPVIGALAKRRGKRDALLLAMAVATVLTPLIGLIGLWHGVSPAVQGYVLIALAGPPLAALFVLPNAILADIAEAHGALTRERSEGMFFALQGLIFNATASLAAGVLGVLLQWLGYAPENPLGLRAVPLVASIAVAAGAIVFTRFPRDTAPALTPGPDP